MVIAYLPHFKGRVTLITQSFVSNTIGVVFQPQGVPQNSHIATGSREDSFMQLLLFISIAHLGILMDIYTNLYGAASAKYLLKAHRPSTRRQYKTAWKSLVCFVKLKKRTMISVSFMLEFLICLFEVRKLQSNTIMSY